MYYNKLSKSVSKTIALYLQDVDQEEGNFNGKTLRLHKQLVKK